MRIRSLIVIIFICISTFTLPSEELESERIADAQTINLISKIDQPVKAALLNNFPPFSFYINSQISGFTIDYIQLLEEKTGLEIDIVEGNWKENFTAFRSGKVDIITGMSYTEERNTYTLFTDPYYLLPTVVYTRKNDFQYNRVDDLKGKVVGIESEIYYRQYLNQIQGIQLKEIEETDELLKQLSFGEIDAVVTNINIGNYMIKQYMLENVQLAGRINLKGIEDEDLRIGVRRELTHLHALIQKGMNRISPGEYKQLQDRWVGFTPQHMQDALSPEDQQLLKDYIENYGGIRLSGQPDWFPIDFYKINKGQQGIAADMFSYVSKEMLLPFVIKKSDSLEESIQDLSKGRTDVVSAIVPSNDYKQQLAFTKPYIRLSMVIASRNSEFFIGDLRSVENKKIGIVKPCSLDGQLKETYPQVDFIEVESVKEGLTKVRDKELFAFIGTVPSIAYAIKEHKFYNIKITGTLQEKLPIAAATRRQDHSLRSLLNRAIMSIDSETKNQIVDNWLVVQMEERIDKTLLWEVLGGAAFLVIVVLIWAHKERRLSSRISEAYELLEQKNIELERLSSINQLTNLYNRHKLDTELEEEIQRASRYGRVFSLIMFDIDWFKNVNDNYGHQAGDTVLKEIASLIRDRVRNTDTAGRWGGEEFLIICPETELSGAAELADHIRSDIAEYNFSIGIKITISAGVTRFYNGETTKEIIHRVDENLYAAKNLGKNRVVTEK